GLSGEPVFRTARRAAERERVAVEGTEASAAGAGVPVRTATDMPLGLEGERVRARHTISAGERLFCALSWAEDFAAPTTADEADARMAATVRYWRGWLDAARAIDHPWRAMIERSALAMKGLTYMPTGATV